MRREQLHHALLLQQEESYRQMQVRLIPNIPAERIIGVRTPVLRGMAQELEDRDSFLSELPHTYFEENQIHCFLLEKQKNFHETVQAVDGFLPSIDNWATCDQLRPKCFCRNQESLLPFVRRWIASEHTYTARFGVGMLMVHYLDESFDPSFLALAASASGEDYYLRMMVAWYFATALAKHYDEAFPYIAENRLDKWVHNKAIQKARESYRVTEGHKRELASYKRK